MKRNDLLALMSFISLVLVSIHIADDYVLGLDTHVLDSPLGVLILAVWAVGLFVLRERLSGRILLLLGGLIAIAMPVIHMRGHYTPNFAASDGAFRFVWTLYAVGTTGAVTVVLALRELLRPEPEESVPMAS